MNYYLEIRLLPDAEANLGFLWHKIFQQVHIALVDNKVADNQSAIGISIPGYFLPSPIKKGFPLGDKLRLFAHNEQALEKLDLAKWLIRFEDYAQVKTIKPVPKCSQYAIFSRKQLQGRKRIEAKTRQMAECKANETGEPFEKWFAEFSDIAPKAVDSLPFITTKSISGGQNSSTGFPLFIEMALTEQPQQGVFNCYGLSAKNNDVMTTVPWFE